MVTDERFADRLLLRSEWVPDEEAADRILSRLAVDRKDIISDPDSQEGGWKCLLPRYRNETFVKWFVQAGLARENSPTPATDSNQNTKSGYPAWLDTHNTRLPSFAAARVHPDFTLSSPNHPIGWPSVLVIGEHASGKSCI